ncbi:MAG: aldose 1-epimerase [Acidobacteria bacterium]|nr:aldose 1-epimerase [Acidobacteriota bacterium]
MNYTAERRTIDGIEVVYLADAKTQTEVWVAPSLGNNSYDMKCKGQRVFWNPYDTVAEFKAKPVNLGNPFLAPWANRLDQEAFWANGKKFNLNPSLNNFRYDQFRQPIHGLILFASQWQVMSLASGEDAASVTSRLEFWRYPEWMAQFPFAHSYEMTYRLKGGVLEVDTTVENLSTAAMPVSLAFHPYFTLPRVPRDDWKVTIPVKEHIVLNSKLTPTGERKPFDLPQPLELRGRQLDDVFSGADPKREFVVEGGGRKVAVRFGTNFPVAVVYAPRGRDFICFEPMTGVTNAFNLAHEGKIPTIQQIAPGGRWRESYFIRAEGY